MQVDYKLRDNRNRGLMITFIVHALLLLLFFFVAIFSPPYPPMPGEPGMAINFGTDDFGQGPENDLPSTENNPQPVQEEQQAVEKQEVADEADVVTTQEESPYKLEEKKEKKVAKEEVKKPVEAVKETPAAKTEPTTKKADSRSLMGNGDKDKAGDQGKTTGSLDSRSLYGSGKTGTGGDGDGNGGAGGNGTLNMAGWRWTSPPKIKDNSSETGKIVFKITVDEDGNVLAVTPVERQVSPAVAKLYEDAVWKLEFEKTKSSQAAQNSTGTITFVIK